MDSIAKRPRTRLSPLKRKQQLMEIALEVFARRAQTSLKLRKFLWRPSSTTSQLAKIL